MGNLDFDSSAVEPVSMGFEPLSPGWYTMRIVDTEVRPSKSGGGDYLKVEFDILGSVHGNTGKGRKHWENFNLWNSNEKAQQIARGQFSALCRACGKVGLVRDSSELHGKTFDAKLRIVPAKDGYEAKNSVSEYKAVEKPVRTAIDDGDKPPF